LARHLQDHGSLLTADLGTAISRAVVNHDQLVVPVRTADQSVKTNGKKLLAVIDGNDYGNEGLVIHDKVIVSNFCAA
jgi:hypothetical protein